MGFEALEKSIHKKLTLQDLNTAKPQKANTAKQQKVKITVYLSEESMRKLNELCSKNLIKTGKQDKSQLMDKAIELLYKEENEREN